MAFGESRTKGFANPSQIFANILKLIGPNAKIIGPGFVFNNKGLFIYDTPTAQLGHLIVSITPASGPDDGVGNPFLTQVTTYTGSGVTSELVSAALRFIALVNPAFTPPGLFTVNASNAGAALNVSSGKGTNVSTVAVMSLVDSLLGRGGVSQVIIGRLNNLLVAESSGLLEVQGEVDIIAQAIGIALAIRLTGDAHERWNVKHDGTFDWGSGAAVTDTTLYRAAASQLASDGIAFNKAGAAETWQAFAAQAGGYQNSWLDGTDGAAAFRLNAAPYKSVSFTGSLTVPIGAASGQQIVTIPAAYRPANPGMIPVRDKTGNKIVFLSVAANGIVAFQQTAGTVATGDILVLSGIIYLDTP